MRPAISILQLDTRFPRVAGDVACPQTFQRDVEIISVPQATVGAIVSAYPADIDITPFEAALAAAKGDVIATSCGFLSYWQSHLAQRTRRPFVSSALVGLEALSLRYEPSEVMIVTFDSTRLGVQHLGAHAAFLASLVGLPKTCHLRDVIENDLPQLDQTQAGQELAQLVTAHQTDQHKHILLECTNLPPYKAAIRAVCDLPITDILTQIDHVRPDVVQPRYL